MKATNLRKLANIGPVAVLQASVLVLAAAFGGRPNHSGAGPPASTGCPADTPAATAAATQVPPLMLKDAPATPSGTTAQPDPSPPSSPSPAPTDTPTPVPTATQTPAATVTPGALVSWSATR